MISGYMVEVSTNPHASMHPRPRADTRIVINVLHVLQSGCTRVLISTLDNVVVTLAVFIHSGVMTVRPDEDIWIAFGRLLEWGRPHIHKRQQSMPLTRCSDNSNE